MGAVKNYMIERDEAVDWLCTCLKNLEDIEYKKYDTRFNRLIKSLINLRDYLDSDDIYIEALRFLDKNKTFINKCIESFQKEYVSSKTLRLLEHVFISALHLCTKSTVEFNTDNFYDEKIDNAKKEESNLKEKLDLLLSQNSQDQNKIASLQNRLNHASKTLSELNAQKELLQKQNDAQNNIQRRIQDSFKILSDDSADIEGEKSRLNWLYYGFLFLSILVLSIFFVLEVILWFHILNNLYAYSEWTDYLPFYLPIPLCAGLLWFSVYQMNRAQRQLLQIARQLHNIKYLEGLLLSINNLSLDLNDGLHKIQTLLDRVADRYVQGGDMIDTSKINRTCSEDKVNIDELMNVLKKIKELVK